MRRLLVVPSALLLVSAYEPWWKADSVEFGAVVLSPDSPDLPIEATVDIGEALLDAGASYLVVVHLSGESRGVGWLGLHVLGGPDEEPTGEPLVQVPFDGSSELDVELGVDGTAVELEDLHLLVRLTGEAEIAAEVTLHVTASAWERPAGCGSHQLRILL